LLKQGKSQAKGAVNRPGAPENPIRGEREGA